ncbi:MAG TPA: hypothetical protein VF265_06580 [Nevskiaceae bacterium]
MANITEIAPDVFRISNYVSAGGMQFNLFLVRDDEPLLYHTLQKALFKDSLDAVRSLIDVEQLRWIGFSHYEADECGALNEWLQVAPKATAIAGVLAAAIGINNQAIRPPKVLEDDAVLTTGRHRLRFLVTPYVPHSWESSLLYDETAHTLFCSDLLAQHGDPAALRDDVLPAAIANLKAGQSTPFHDSIPYTRTTSSVFKRLIGLRPETLAIMHGGSYRGDGAEILRLYHEQIRDMLMPSRDEALQPAAESSPA